MTAESRPPGPQRSFFRRHPLLADALLWALPALIFGAALRILLTAYLPYAFWGDDSRSYFTFAHKFLINGSISLGDKRRYLYPLLMLPVSYLPGGPLRWLPVFQHTFGVLTLLPLAYVVRRTLVLWRLWIIPVTVIYAGLPITVWCEHELLGDHLFFALLIWTFAGWVAWVSGRTGVPPSADASETPIAPEMPQTAERARRLFWFFLVPFALFIITKPSGRFFWIGVLAGLLLVRAWRVLRWPQWAALFVVLTVTPTVGSKKQGAWLFYNAVYPLTQVDTPRHADYKAEIRESVERFRNNLDTYHAYREDDPFLFLRDPGDQDARPLWKALGKDEKRKDKLYMDLAKEGVFARPDLFLYLGYERLIMASNVSDFAAWHFADGNFIDESRVFYKEAVESEDSPLRIAYNFPRTGPVPDHDAFQHQVEPAPGSWPARFVQSSAAAYGTKLDLVRLPQLPRKQIRLSLVRPTALGCWLLLALPLSWLPRYRRTLGIWALAALGYVFPVFLISVVNVHYFAPIWPILLVVLPVPVDALLSRLLKSPVSAARPPA